MTQENKIKLKIILVIFLIFCALFLVIYINKGKTNNKDSNTLKLLEVDNYNIYFSVQKNLNKFIEYYVKNEKSSVYNMLNEKYKKENNIDLNSNIKLLNTFSENAYLKNLKEKYYKLNDNVNCYYVKGDLYEDSFEEDKFLENNIHFLVLIDYNNITFEIIPVESLEDSIKWIKKLNKDYEITKNNYNALEGINVITKENICLMYLSDFVTLATNNPKEAYKLVENFDTYDKFSNFLKTSGQTFVVSSCEVYKSNKKNIYSIVDGNKIHYRFTENNIMDYTVTMTK